MFFLDLQRWES